MPKHCSITQSSLKINHAEGCQGSGAEGSARKGSGRSGGHVQEDGVLQPSGGGGWRVQIYKALEKDSTHPFWGAFWIEVQHIIGLIIVVLISAVQGGVPQVGHSKEVDCGGRSNWLCCQEAVHLTQPG